MKCKERSISRSLLFTFDSLVEPQQGFNRMGGIAANRPWLCSPVHVS